MAKLGVLLMNLGSPDSPSVPDVRRYLREFLTDARVIDLPVVRNFVVPGIILPTRPKRSAAAYASIWTPEGSPLIVMSKRQRALLQDKVDFPVFLSMRYANPSTPKVLGDIVKEGVTDLYVIPLYPHYAMSSWETAVVQVREEAAKLAPKMRLTVMAPFYQEPGYINALVESARPHLAQDYDLLLFSYHGIPRRHLCLGDPSKAHCQKVENCCFVSSPVQATCYKHQTHKTTELFVKAAGIPEGKWMQSFQSRLGKETWLEPYTNVTLEKLGKAGKVKKLLVMAPAFVTDCLETIDELAVEGAEEFIHAGGEKLTLIPCLNDHPAWITYLHGRVREWQESHTHA